jgi:hypothetical protein
MRQQQPHKPDLQAHSFFTCFHAPCLSQTLRVSTMEAQLPALLAACLSNDNSVSSRFLTALFHGGGLIDS